MSNSIIATVIFDNGGGITLQLQETDSFESWAHCYDDPRVAATDLKAAFVEGFGQFDGHSDDADGLDPSDDQIRNGSYSIVRFASRDDASKWAESITCDNSCGENMTGVAAELVRAASDRVKYDMSLYDSDTSDRVNADELEISLAEYDRLVQESIDCPQKAGHVRTSSGRSVFAL